MLNFNQFLNEASFKLGSTVTIVKGPKYAIGKEGRVGEIRTGLYKGAPKTYTIDHSPDENGNLQSIQLPVTHIRHLKNIG